MKVENDLAFNIFVLLTHHNEFYFRLLYERLQRVCNDRSV